MERWDVMDKDRNLLGKTIERGQSLEKGEYHLVVFAWIRNKEGNYIITKRAANKPHPLLWETTGGSALAGESSEEAVLREVKEEVGITLQIENGKKLMSDYYETACSYIVDIWLFEQDVDINDVSLQVEEVCDVTIATKEDIVHLIHTNQFVASRWLNECLPYL
ncbi:MAG: NUDIX domain-containing protein [Bacillaceae bacterium]